MFFLYISLVLLLIAATVFAKHRSRKYYYVLKPAAIILIFLYPLLFSQNCVGTYGTLILLGMLFAIAGDILLLYPENFFKYGLLSFSLTHIFYASAFFYLGTNVQFLYLFPVGVAMIIFYVMLAKFLGNYKLPVIYYAVVISIMLFAAICYYVEIKNMVSTVILTGALLLVISDVILAWNKFKKKFNSAEIWILTTYYTGQLLLALSI